MGSLPPNNAVAVAVAAAAAVVLAALVTGGSCWTDDHPKVPPGPNITADYDGKWLAAKGTWYGSPVGAGPDDNGGACGFMDVNLPPYSGMTACGNSPIYKDGKGCGSCYEIRCTAAPQECSDAPVVVFITDANDYYPIAPYHFDLSGTAFGSLAKPGLADQLRHRGIIDLQFRRVRCKYAPGKNIVFHVEHGSDPFHLALLVKFVAGDGDIVQMDLKQGASSLEWEPMNHSWGATWTIEMGPHKPLKGPFSVRLTSSESGKQLVATDVIPEDWKPDTTYQSNIQF